MKLFTTLNIIRDHFPCSGSWQKALKLLGKTKADDEPLSFEWILENLGLDDALWGLRAVSEENETERDRLARMFACDCAERVLVCWYKHYPKDHRPKEAICVARKFAQGEASQEELDAARAAWDAARAAWDAAMAAWAAASAAAWAAARDARDAATAAASAAATAAAWAAWDAAMAARAAWDAEEKEQIKLFKKHFCSETGVAA